MKVKKSSKGFTLVEMIVAIAISGIFCSIVLAISVTSGKLFSNVQSESNFNDKARIIISTIEDDLRVAKDIKGSNGIVSKDINIAGNTYKLSSSESIGEIIVTYTKSGVAYAYILSSGNICKYKADPSNTLNRVGGGFSEVNKMSILKEDDGTKYDVTIELKNKKGETMTFTDVITPRNS